MSKRINISKSSAIIAAASMVLGSTAAHASSVTPASIDPLYSLSVFGTQSSRAAVCAAGAAGATAAATAAAAASGQDRGVGCVLPVLGTAPPPAVVGAGAVAVPGAVAGLGGLGALGSLLPLALIAGFGLLAAGRVNKATSQPSSPA